MAQELVTLGLGVVWVFLMGYVVGRNHGADIQAETPTPKISVKE